MIVVIFGTTGELIKLAPILRRLDDRGLRYLTISTNQQVNQIGDFQRDLKLPPSDMELAHGNNGHDLGRIADLPAWITTVSREFLAQSSPLRRRLSRSSERHMALVHGDTMTTVLGAVMGRLLGLPVAHLEAGMRSGNWRHPFPEELNRRAAGRLATIHYATTGREVSNLHRAPGEVVLIGANTVLDSIELVPAGRKAARDVLGDLTPEGPYGLISLHRTELLRDRERLKAILDEISRTRFSYPMFFVDHPVTVAAMKSHGLDDSLSTFVRIARLPYTAFIALLRECEFLLTDSGGCQEECFYLDVPCLVHRLVTERHEGIGRNVVVSNYDINVVADFLRDPSRFRMGERPVFPSPSDVVVEDLISRGVWAAA